MIKRNDVIIIFVGIILSIGFIGGNPVEEYFLGDLLKLDLRDYSEPVVRIESPSGSYTQRVNGDYFTYEFGEIGNYRIDVKSSEKRDLFEYIVSEEREENLVGDNLNESERYYNDKDSIYLDIENVSFEEVNESKFIKYRNEIRIKGDERIKVGEDVRWVQKKFVTAKKNLIVKIPEVSRRITLNGSEEIDYEIKDSPFNLFDDKKSLIINEVQGNLEIEYTTPAPMKKEKIISEDKKRVTISSEGKLGYKNILAFTEIEEKIPVGKESLIEIYWVEEEKDVGFEAFDKDGNGYYDFVEWNVQHLSNQNFDVILNILNVQSYPLVGRNWTVEFETLGKADLKIRAFNETTWSDSNSVNELRFLEIKCGENYLDYVWDEGIFISDYECNETSFEVSQVLSAGAHYLEFNFGGGVAIAQNDATDQYDNLTQVYTQDFTQEFPLGTPVTINLTSQTIVDEGYLIGSIEYGWNQRKNITINVQGLSQDLDDFPLLIEITDTDLRDRALNNGGDILFTKSDGSTQVPHEIEYYDGSTGDLTVWVKIDISSSETNLIWMYYNNSGASDQQDMTGTWNTDYGLVYHMNSSRNDSTINDRDAVSTVGTPVETTDFLGYGQYFDSSSSEAWSQTNLPYWESQYDVRIHEIVFEVGSDVSTRQTLFAEGGGTNGILNLLFYRRSF